MRVIRDKLRRLLIKRIEYLWVINELQGKAQAQQQVKFFVETFQKLLNLPLAVLFLKDEVSTK